MIRSFKHKGLKKFFESGTLAGIQAQHADRLRFILARLCACQVPADINLPGLKLHKLSGNLKGFFALTVQANWRITFRFTDKDVFDVDYLDYH